MSFSWLARILVSALFFYCTTFHSSYAYSNEVGIAIAAAPKNPTHAYIVEKLRENINNHAASNGLRIKIDYLDDVSNYQYLISLGQHGIDTVSQMDRGVPALFALLTRYKCNKVLDGKNSNSHDSCLSLDYPTHKYLELIKSAFPYKNNVVTLLADASDWRIKDLDNNQDDFKIKTLHANTLSTNNMLSLLRENIKKGDVFIAFPDNQIYKSESVQGILINTYHAGVPLIGFSKSFTKAGASISLFSSRDQIVEQMSDLIIKHLKKTKLPTGIIYPTDYSVTINKQVLKSLNLSTPDADMLFRQLGGAP